MITRMGVKLLAEESQSPQQLQKLIEGSFTNLSMALKFPKRTQTSTVSPTMPRMPQRYDETPVKMNGPKSSIGAPLI